MTATCGSIGIGPNPHRNPPLVLAQDLENRIVDAATGEFLRELTL